MDCCCCINNAFRYLIDTILNLKSGSSNPDTEIKE